ncbi:NAD(FAD)-dependent dehydrogenase [Fructilactobacillus lindneri]|uniref:NADH peroxidase n=2 Tax=Fructilactobacillus lindneri TaxID=53444 RepID=A0A0R2JUI9_9LACO|nr:FAD-dependent oxidoreductase [Fructilactobacillus lindneri]ANZ58063.1 NAD(FAD)-dependent dehydrogenase [Fructilactobacillus lindneri]ANZ59384.1 NAD(FAD)-dependent dehydrogenase [Fructilactobacillus lindneri]KRN80683.1 NADH peroxidase [Fructilactobacillus lindneri DSM 20690 = JCM 11027]POG98832.1 NAD(FAD)-dependent dehydrogenase [Fructilactobacillus lindneri]POH03105.1 NAD(FAD)-dependent dehydrogenase [Fructilactobacillus lindneri]
MKVAVVGSSHGGFEAVRGVLHDFPDAEIDWYEKGDFISFLSCGMELYLQGIVKDVNSVSYATIPGMEEKGVHVRINSDVTNINPKSHTITVVDVNNGKEKTENYDKLILSIGAVPFQLPVPGKDLQNIYAMRGRDWAILLKEAEVKPDIKNVTVVGSGYIGIEAAESFAKAGMHVTIIDLNPSILGTYLDPEFTDILADKLKNEGIDIRLDQSVKEYIGNSDKKVTSVVSTNGDSWDADLVIETAGIRPATKWLDGIVDLNERGLIKTDEYQQTNQTDIFAAGDATEVEFAPTGKKQQIALATNARRQGRSAAHNLNEKLRKTTAVSGSSALHVYDYKFASTGVKDVTAAKCGVKVDSVFVKDTKVPPFVPADHNAEVYFKLTYNPENREIMGAQIMSKMDTTANINTISLAIQQHLTVDDLAYADFFFQPGFDRPWNIMNVAAQKAQDKLDK